MWGIAITILNYFTPIFYSITILPDYLQNIFRLNPLYMYINATREILLFSTAPQPVYLLACFGTGFVTMIIGLAIFKRKQDKFVYYL